MMRISPSPSPMARLSRRVFMSAILGGAAAIAFGSPALAQSAAFERWVATFRARALARGISGATYDRVMNGLKPDTSVYALQRAQPEFTEQLWQYINRRCSDWRVTTGKQRAREHAPLLARLEKDFGVDRYVLLGLWGMELSFGDVMDNPKYMRPIIPALAALAYGEPRRRKYWETELLNALTIVERGWAQPDGMIGSWAGAMGHTQWMPEVWLNIGIDYDRDGRANPFGKPDDALAGSAQYLLKRGRYRPRRDLGHRSQGPRRAARGWPTTRPCDLTRNGRSSASGAPMAPRFRGRAIRCGYGCRSPADRRS